MTIQFDPRLVDAAASALELLKKQINGLKAAVISTEDGFEVVAWLRDGASAARLSAMVSSLAALGSVAGEENQLGHCENIAVSFSDGHLVSVQARHAGIILSVSAV